MNLRAAFISSACAVAFAAAVHADVLRLRDGRIFHGHLMGANAYEVRFQPDNGPFQRVDIGNVDSISFNDRAGASASAGPYSNQQAPGSYNQQAPGYYNSDAYNQNQNAPYPPSSAYPQGTPPYTRNSPAPYPQSATQPAYPENTYPAPPPDYPQATPQPYPAQRSTPSADNVIPAGTVIVVRTIDPIDSDSSQAGQTYPANLAQPIVVNGQVIAPRGSDCVLQIVRVRQGGRYEGNADIGVALASISIDGRTYPLDTNTD